MPRFQTIVRRARFVYSPYNTAISGGSNTAFCHAALNERADILALLVQKGVDVNQPCVQDIPVIFTTEKPEIARSLLDAGAKVEFDKIWVVCNKPRILGMLMTRFDSIQRISAGIVCSAVSKGRR
jgi:hypothetical protein